MTVCAVALAAATGCGEGERDAENAPAGIPLTGGGSPVVATPSVIPSLELVAAALPPAVEALPEPGCAPGKAERLRSERVAYAAVARGKTIAHRRPGGEPLHRFERLNANGVPTVFGVLAAILGPDCEPAWYRVQLPVRPNGTVGYVRARDVDLIMVTTRIEVDLSTRRLVLYRDGRRVLHAKVAVGAEITPTPSGEYYVNQRLTAPDPWGPFGPAAIGISAFSPVLQDWIQGGPVAIHGTNDPGSIGRAASHGCVRVRNDVISVLFRQVPVGTPVLIRA